MKLRTMIVTVLNIVSVNTKQTRKIHNQSMRVAETSPFGLYKIYGGGFIIHIKN